MSRYSNTTNFDALDHKSIKQFLLNEIKSIKLIIIFGSFAKGDDNKDSDLDIAFLTAQQITNVKRWQVAQSLASQINRDVDLVDLSNANDVFKFQIVSQGQIIYQLKNMDSYLDQVYLTYLKLNEDRQGIIDNYGK